MNHLQCALAALVAASLSTSRVAQADPQPPVETPANVDEAPSGKGAPPEPFGMTGTRALGLVFELGPANSGLATRPLGMASSLALDSFVLGGLSVGAEFGFQYSTADGSFYDVGGGPRVGYAIPLGNKLALWPVVILSYEAGTVPVQTSADSVSLQDMRIGGQLPLVMTLGGQTAIELGPVASTDLWRSVAGQSAQAMNILGLRAGIVGWF